MSRRGRRLIRGFSLVAVLFCLIGYALQGAALADEPLTDDATAAVDDATEDVAATTDDGVEETTEAVDEAVTEVAEDTSVAAPVEEVTETTDAATATVDDAASAPSSSSTDDVVNEVATQTEATTDPSNTTVSVEQSAAIPTSPDTSSSSLSPTDGTSGGGGSGDGSTGSRAQQTHTDVPTEPSYRSASTGDGFVFAASGGSFDVAGSVISAQIGFEEPTDDELQDLLGIGNEVGGARVLGTQIDSNDDASSPSTPQPSTSNDPGRLALTGVSLLVLVATALGLISLGSGASTVGARVA